MYRYSPLVCPHCYHEDMVQKVSVIVEEGTMTGVEYGWVTGRAGGRRFRGHTVEWHRQQTVLATLLAPPRRPVHVTGLAAVVAGFFLMVFLYCIASQAVSTAVQANPEVLLVLGVLAVFALVLFVLLLRGVSNSATYHRRDWLEWQRQMCKWQSLYYCHRCGAVFIPGIPVHVPASAAKAFVAQL
jgi:hypothetical protein